MATASAVPLRAPSGRRLGLPPSWPAVGAARSEDGGSASATASGGVGEAIAGQARAYSARGIVLMPSCRPGGSRNVAWPPLALELMMMEDGLRALRRRRRVSALSNADADSHGARWAALLSNYHVLCCVPLHPVSCLTSGASNCDKPPTANKCKL